MNILKELTNNEKREQFLDSYKDWELWIQVFELDEKYYRYILPTFAQVVVKEIEHRHAKDYWIEEKRGEKYVTTEYYLIEDTRNCFADCKSSKSQIIEYLRKHRND